MCSVLWKPEGTLPGYCRDQEWSSDCRVHRFWRFTPGVAIGLIQATERLITCVPAAGGHAHCIDIFIYVYVCVCVCVCMYLSSANGLLCREKGTGEAVDGV